jgi:hypothetical protein
VYQNSETRMTFKTYPRARSPELLALWSRAKSGRCLRLLLFQARDEKPGNSAAMPGED